MQNTKKLTLSAEASKHFVETLQDKTEPNDVLKKAAEHYKTLIGDCKIVEKGLLVKNLRNTETNESVNFLSINAEIENNDIDFSLEAEHTFADKLGKLTLKIDNDKTVSAKIKVEF